MRLSTGTVRGVPLIRIEGDVDPDDAPTLQRAIWDSFAGGDAQIVFDLEACTFVSSTGMAVFFSLMNWVRAKRGRVLLVRPSANVLRLCRLVRLIDESSFQVVTDLEGGGQATLTERDPKGLS